ncbi:MAG: sporulation protein [Clostridiaceae bacterium]|nr:sporulation protein [Clostridiaceae bacterium]
MSTNFTENAGTLFEKLENFFTSKTVVGETISIGNITLIPMVDISFGIGTGGGDGIDDKGNKGMGAGGGVGAKASPTAVIVIKDDEVQVLPINQKGGMEKLIDMVPDILSKVNLKKKDIEEKKEEE